MKRKKRKVWMNDPKEVCPQANKQVYRSPDDARAVMAARNWTGGSIYPCEACRGFHISSQIEPYRLTRREPAST